MERVGLNDWVGSCTSEMDGVVGNECINVGGDKWSKNVRERM